MTAPRASLALVAGEASGDLIAAEALGLLLRRAESQHRPISLVGIGGPALSGLGMDCWFASERLAVRGYVEALSRIREILSIRRALLSRLYEAPPALFLGVDAPDFNLTVEARLRAIGVPTVHLVSPSIWAWRPERIHRISEAVDHMLCLFPFEPACYAGSRVTAHFVGHPLADLIPLESNPTVARGALGLSQSASPEKPILALLPGSRLSEIRLVGEAFLQAAIELSPQLLPVCPVASEAIRSEILRLPSAERALAAGLQLLGPVSPVPGRPISHLVLESSACALVASGTATLEAALFRIPQVIGYRVPRLTHWMMRRKALVSRVGLPNLLVEPDLVPECLQDDCNGPRLAAEVRAWMDEPSRLTHYQEKTAQLHEQLRQGTASRVAEILDALLSGSVIPGLDAGPASSGSVSP